MAHKTMAQIIAEAADRAVSKSDLPGATLGAILAEAGPVVDYVEDYRRAVVKYTVVVAYTLHGDPLRAAAR